LNCPLLSLSLYVTRVRLITPDSRHQTELLRTWNPYFLPAVLFDQSTVVDGSFGPQIDSKEGRKPER
jgi:hypothetical protein